MKKLLLPLFVLCINNLYAQTYTHTLGGPINDNTTASFTLNVPLTQIIDASFGVTQVCVNLNHTYDSDLKIRLTSPFGTVVMLSGNHGGSGDNYTNTCFAQNGVNGPIAGGVAPFTGTFIPDNSINLFNSGQIPTGVWTLTVQDEVPADLGNLISFSITFGPNPPADQPGGGGGGGGGTPCSETNGASCLCPDGVSTDCDLLPDMLASANVIQYDHTEYTGQIRLGNGTPNIGWGPMEVHGVDTCYCGTTVVPCSMTTCPNGQPVKQLVLQTIYHKNGSNITKYNRRAGYMSHHPTHGHMHVDNWAEYTLRKDNGDPNPLNWPIYGTGSKVSFCLINLGDCNSNPNNCKDEFGVPRNQSNIANYGFGSISGCGQDQGIFVGNYDVYSSGLDGQYIDIPNICNGNYYIVSVTDPDNMFLESNENNNVAVYPITLADQLPQPTASFTYTQSGSSIILNGIANNASTYYWNFGDGSSPVYNVLSPSHTYSGNGVYTITLTVINQCNSVTSTQTISVGPVGIKQQQEKILTAIAQPNPFEKSTTVTYYNYQKGNVNVEIYNLIGELVSVHTSEIQLPGKYEIVLDQQDFRQANGSFLLKISTSEYTKTLKLIKAE